MVKRRGHLTVVSDHTAANPDTKAALEKVEAKVAQRKGKPVKKTAPPARKEETVDEMQDVSCSGCGRFIAVAPSPHYRIFCSAWCAHYPAVDTKTEQRDHQIEYLATRRAVSTKALAGHYDLTRQRIQQILGRRAS